VGSTVAVHITTPRRILGGDNMSVDTIERGSHVGGADDGGDIGGWDAWRQEVGDPAEGMFEPAVDSARRPPLAIYAARQVGRFGIRGVESGYVTPQRPRYIADSLGGFALEGTAPNLN
jgi:hypothetical protein